MTNALNPIKCRCCAGTGRYMRGLKPQPCDICEGKGKFPQINSLDRELFMDAATATWNAIAPDIDQYERLPLKHVVEIVMDSDHMIFFGGQNGVEKQRLKQLLYGMPAYQHRELRKWVAEAL